jgi:hypothetical protein
MQERSNWMDQISKRNDDELRKWAEEATNPRLLTLAMAELNLRSVKRLKASLDEYAITTEQHSRRIAALSKTLIGLTLVLILVALPPAITETKRLIWGEPQFVQAVQPGSFKAVSPAVDALTETDCANQAGKTAGAFVQTLREKEGNLRFGSSSHHLNQRLQKCFTEIRMTGGIGDNMGSHTYILDAKANTTQIHCFTAIAPSPNVKYPQCFDSKLNVIPPEDSEKRILDLMGR